MCTGKLKVDTLFSSTTLHLEREQEICYIVYKERTKEGYEWINEIVNGQIYGWMVGIFR